MAYPRLTALAEVVWSPREARDWTDFQRRLNPHLTRLKLLDVNDRPLGENKPTAAAGWKAGDIGQELVDREWDVTGKIKRAGNVQVLFLYSSGEHRLEIQKVELLEDGKVVSVDEHAGSTGHVDSANTYKLKLPKLNPQSKYVLRAKVRADGGNDSNGEIYLLPERADDWL
jgi:hexosaminidase